MGRLTNFLEYSVPDAKYVCIAPFWAGSPWFNRLLRISDHALILPPDKLFVQI